MLRKQVKIIQNNVVCVDSSSSSPTVAYVSPEVDTVGGVTSLGDDVFVVRYNCEEKIEVIDAKNFALQRHITVPGLGDYCMGLVACQYNNCLYASNTDKRRVHRVDLSGSNVMNWSVAGWPAGLSVNSEHNLLVVSQGVSKLQIFTTHGTLLQNIQLQADIEYPHHAVQLPNGQFLVSHTGFLHRVCLVGMDGAVVRSYGGLAGRELTQMNNPRGLAVDTHGWIYVADRDNGRLLLIDESLSSADESLGDLEGPYSLWFDQRRRRFYIGEWYGGRMIVYDNLKEFGPSTS